MRFTNVHVPQWDRIVLRNGQQSVEEAWLDVKIADRDAREDLDTKIFCPFAPSYRGKAHEKPAAHERDKHARYPTHNGGRRILPVDLHAAVFIKHQWRVRAGRQLDDSARPRGRSKVARLRPLHPVYGAHGCPVVCANFDRVVRGRLPLPRR